MKSSETQSWCLVLHYGFASAEDWFWKWTFKSSHLVFFISFVKASNMRLFSKKSIPYAKINATPDVDVHPEPPRVRIAVLGSSGVGKTSIIQQFMCNYFSEKHKPTKRKQCYYPSVIINEKLYDVTITDCPTVPHSLTKSFLEWSDFHEYGLGNATAFVLVFDVSDEESFSHLQSLRDQILQNKSRSCDIPMLVVGNKRDIPQVKTLTKKDFSAIVTTEWKCPYVESSAKSNWHIMLIFKELMKFIDCIDLTHKQKPHSFRRRRSNDDKKCTILWCQLWIIICQRQLNDKRIVCLKQII